VQLESLVAMLSSGTRAAGVPGGNAEKYMSNEFMFMSQDELE
jgi:hypothetical protein